MKPGEPTDREIVAEVAAALGLQTEPLLSGSSARDACRERAIAAQSLRDQFGWKIERIGYALGRTPRGIHKLLARTDQR